MSHKVISALIIASTMTIASAASAQDAYVVGTVGATGATHTIERDLGPNPPALPVPDAGGTTSSNEDSVSFEIGAGVQFDLGQSRSFIGLEGFYGIEDGNSRNINGVLVTDVDLDARYGGRALLGYHVTDGFDVYTHAGLTFVEYDLTNSYTFAPPVTTRSNTDSEFSYGAGMRYRLTDNLSAVVDYTRVSNIVFDGIPEVAGGTGRVNPNNLSLDRFATGLLFKF